MRLASGENVLKRLLLLFILAAAMAGGGLILYLQEIDGGASQAFAILRLEREDHFAEFPHMDRPYEGPLPWEQDGAFLAALKRHGNPRLMAAYRATLKDPLPGEDYNVGLAAKKLAGTVIAPGKMYSQNGTIGPYTRKRGYRPGPTYKGTSMITTVGGGVCKVASVTYNVATFCNFDIVQRYAHGMTVPYVPPGQDATVYYGSKDFRFQNNTGKPVLLWAQKVDDDLFVAAYGFAAPPRIVWHHKVLKSFKYWKKYRRNPALRPDEERVVLPGAEGYLVKSWVTIENADGTVATKSKGLSFYSPFPEVVERSARR